MSDKPNVLVIMTDQQRYDTIGALGNSLIQTPALDRLVTGGTSFTSAYCASPVCVASRCSFVLGEYPHMTGCTANTPMPNGERSEYYYIPQPSQVPDRLHNTTWTGDRTLDFLERRDNERPFFLWMSFFKPHPPFEAPLPWHRLYRLIEMEPPEVPPENDHLLCYWNHFQNRYKYRDQGNDMNLIRAMRAMYYSIISHLDYQIGRVLDRLESEGILDDTLAIFTSDHGEFLGDYNSYGKRSFLDLAARVPLLVRYPERFGANVQCDTPVSLVDALPTLLGAASIETEPQHAGVDLADIASGASERDDVIGQLSEESKGLYALITRDYKYMYSAADRKEWLFRRLPVQIEK
jgi:arylsulfatase